MIPQWTFCFLQCPKMFLIDNTEHINLLIEVIKDLENVEQNVCLKTKDGEKFYVNQVLLSIVFPYLGNILDGYGSESVVFVVPLEMRMLRMVLDIKLRGFVNINDQEDIWRIIQAFDILGEKIGADQLVKHRALSGDCPISDIKKNSENLVNIKDEVGDPCEDFLDANDLVEEKIKTEDPNIKEKKSA